MRDIHRLRQACAALAACALIASTPAAAPAAHADEAGAGGGRVVISNSDCSWRAYELVAGTVHGDRIADASTAGLMNQTFWKSAGVSGHGQDAAEELARIAADDGAGSKTAKLGRAAEASASPHVNVSKRASRAGFRLPSGYWLLVSDTSQPMLLLVGHDGVDAELKSTKPTVDKQVRTGGDWKKAVEAGEGWRPRYRIVSSMPSNAAAYDSMRYRVVDSLPAGIATDPDDVTVTASRPDGWKKDITAWCGVTVDGGGLVVDVGRGNVMNVLSDDIAQTKITVSYSGLVGPLARSGSRKGNPDTVHVEYTGSPTTDKTHETVRSTAQVLTWKVRLLKTGEGRALKGARFSLVGADGKDAGSGETDGSGSLTFPKVASGTYRLVETEAPDGFAKCADTVVNVSAAFDGDVSRATLSASAKGPGKVVEADAVKGRVTVTVDDSRAPSEPVAPGGGTWVPSGSGGGTGGGSYAKTGATIAGGLIAAAAAAAAGAALLRRGRRKHGDGDGTDVPQGDSAL